ncbi:MAG: hypothetical protein AB4290_05675 [Spirulina sp.]
MLAYEVMGTIDEKGELSLDEPLEINTPCRVKVLVLLSDNPNDEPDDDSDIEPDDTPVEEIEASLRRALQEVKEGKTRPISELWERIYG